MWTKGGDVGSSCWTSPDFPGYEIEKYDDSSHL